MGLLFATAAAFAITEHLKLVKAPLTGTRVSKYFSPTCGCATSAASIGFKLRHHDVVTARILDAENHVVATLAADRPEPKGRVQLVWHGRTDAGVLAPDGRYSAEIHLRDAHWEILLPNPINLDTRAPLVRSVTLHPAVISPDGDGHDNQVKIRYRLSEQANLIVWHGSRVLLVTRATRPDGKTSWKGRTAGRAWRAGTYTLTFGAVDLAGNRTPRAQRKRLTIVVRYVTLGQRRISAAVGKRFAVRVNADAPYTWTFDRRSGNSHAPVLRLRAPAQSGRYHLRVTESGHTASALVVVR